MDAVLARALAHERGQTGKGGRVVFILAVLAWGLPLMVLIPELTHDPAARHSFCRGQAGTDAALVKACMDRGGYGKTLSCDGVEPVRRFSACTDVMAACNATSISESNTASCVADKRREAFIKTGMMTLLPIALGLAALWWRRASTGNTEDLADALRPGAVRWIQPYVAEYRVNGVVAGSRNLLRLHMIDGRTAELGPPPTERDLVVNALLAQNPGCEVRA